MSIKLKIIFIVIPLIICVLLATTAISVIYSRASLVRLTQRSFSFKSNQFEKYINEQWSLLEDNGLDMDENFVSAFYDSLKSQAFSLTEDTSELIFAFNSANFTPVFSTQDTDQTELTETEHSNLSDKLMLQFGNLSGNDAQEGQSVLNSYRGWISQTFQVSGVNHVGYFFTFAPKNLIVVVATTSKDFYSPIVSILLTNAVVMILAILLSTMLIVQFTGYITKPLSSIVASMQEIIATNSFDQRVQAHFNDEVGELSMSFNTMVEELGQAYDQVKQYAYSAILARKNETKVRNIFQKYVPANVIDQLFSNPSASLEGQNKVLSVMFTDIRSFTTISESFKPNELVQVLNSYFEKMVDVITTNEGIIDKYIGDAIMAFFGAPVDLENSPHKALQSGLEMVHVLETFNNNLRKKNMPPFITGIGINYGLVTVGNIGSEKKMDYTVIGDSVNFASRLEGLTKPYKQDIIFSESVKDAVGNTYKCRLIDSVQVKGKTTGEKIYSTILNMSKVQEQVVDIHNEALAHYFSRNFQAALNHLRDILKISAADFLARVYIKRCTNYLQNPPSDDWNGVYVMTTK